MNNQIKKGDLVYLIYTAKNIGELETSGVVISLNTSELVIGHNFSGNRLIDMTKIKLNEIKNSQKIKYSKFNR